MIPARSGPGLPAELDALVDLGRGGRLAADLAIVGGGLAGCVTALAFRQRHPSAHIVVIESGPQVAGNHTWCCFASDLDAQGDRGDRDRVAGHFRQALLEAIVEHRWASHRVVFPSFERVIEGDYLCVTAARLRQAMASEFLATPRSILLTGTRARILSDDTVALPAGRELRARRVLDARGAGTPPASLSPPVVGLSGSSRDLAAPARMGFQKFVGQELVVRGSRARFMDAPVVMDATVPQHDGFRFMYGLPLGAGRLLLEDTSFSNGCELDVAERRERIAEYARLHGIDIAGVAREEHGVLPMPWSPEDCRERAVAGVGERIGYAAGLFHAGTGYSLSVAVEMALSIAREGSSSAARPTSTAEARSPETAPIRARLAAQNRFFGLLNRLMFVGVPPANRRELFERFYRLPEGVIRRFYGARITWTDRARLLLGRPPRGFRWQGLLARSAAGYPRRALARASNASAEPFLGDSR